MVFILLLFITVCYSIELNNPFYLPCNDSQTQKQYFEIERISFDIHHSVSPFNLSILVPEHQSYFPMSCRNEDGLYTRPELSHVEYLCNHTDLELMSSVKRFTMFDGILSNTINLFWKFTNWKHVKLSGEEYMFFQNNSTNNTVFFLHGINVMNGLENLYLLNDITKRANVYILIYRPILYFDTTPYTNTYYETIINLEHMIRNVILSNETALYQLIGNSFGTIQITTLCKRYPSLCMKMTDIILTDPVLVNFPYSKTSDIVTYGVFIKHSDYNIDNYIVNKLRIKRYYDIFHKQIDWYEWSVDSLFIRTFAKQLVLVIGKQDNMINVKHSPILDECRVIYTDTVHGFVIFENFMDKLGSCDAVL